GQNNSYVAVSSNVKEGTVAAYVNIDAPECWTGNSDGGLTDLFTQINSGGLLPTPAAATVTSGGTTTALTCASCEFGGGSVPASPANGTIISFVTGATQGGGTSPTMKA